MRESMETAMNEMKATVAKCDEKVDQIMPTDQVLKIVHDTIENNLNELTMQVKDLSSTLHLRFQMLYDDELYEKPKFGPFDGAQFRTMKEFVIHHLSHLNSAIQTTEHNTGQTL